MEDNNKFLKSNDSNKPPSCIIYLDANNLYGHSMMKLSQTEIFQLVNLKDFNLHSYFSDSLINFFLEFDLHYPDKLYDYHNDYHLTGGKIEVNKDLLSDYQLQIKEDKKFSLVRNKKRIPNLGKKIKHKPQYQNSKLYLKKIQRTRLMLKL